MLCKACNNEISFDGYIPNNKNKGDEDLCTACRYASQDTFPLFEYVQQYAKQGLTPPVKNYEENT